MTNKQRREYKQANQERKARIRALAKMGKPNGGYWASMGLVQNGKFTDRRIIRHSLPWLNG